MSIYMYRDEPTPTFEFLLVWWGWAWWKSCCYAWWWGWAWGLIYCSAYSATCPSYDITIWVGWIWTTAAIGCYPDRSMWWDSCFWSIVAYWWGVGWWAHNSSCCAKGWAYWWSWGWWAWTSNSCNWTVGWLWCAWQWNDGGRWQNFAWGGGWGACQNWTCWCGTRPCNYSCAWNWWYWITSCITWTNVCYAWWGGGGWCCKCASYWNGRSGWGNWWCYQQCWCPATTYWSWGGWGWPCAVRCWGNWCQWVFIISYPNNCWYNINWWDCCYECDGKCIHIFLSDWTLTV